MAQSSSFREQVQLPLDCMTDFPFNFLPIHLVPLKSDGKKRISLPMSPY